MLLTATTPMDLHVFDFDAGGRGREWSYFMGHSHRIFLYFRVFNTVHSI